MNTTADNLCLVAVRSSSAPELVEGAVSLDGQSLT